MRAKILVFSALFSLGLGACVSAKFEKAEGCGANETLGADGRCQPNEAAGAGGQAGAAGAGGPASGSGGMVPVVTPVLQVPPRRVGLRRARAFDVSVGLQQPVNVDLNVTVDGLPPYLSAEPLTLKAGSTSGVLVMRATNDAPLGVPSQARVRAAGAAQAAEAVLDVWVQGEPGTLDTSFGEGGVVDSGAETYNVVGVVPMTDGSLVVVGNSKERRDVTLTHYTQSGQFDTQFGGEYTLNGTLHYAPPSGATPPRISPDREEARAIAVQGDGKIVVFGIRKQLENGEPGGEPQIKGYQWHISRHLPGGSLDISFGEGGAISISDAVAAPAEPEPLDYYSIPLGGVAIGSDRKIVVAARDSYASGSPQRLMRLTPDGALDKTFGDQGIVRGVALPCQPRGLAVSEAGDITVIGGSPEGQGREQVCIARFLATGLLDAEFGTAGVKVLPVLQQGAVLYERAYDVALSPDGLLVSGFTRIDNSGDKILLSKLLPNGSYEPSFGQSGRSFETPPSLSTGDAIRITAMLAPRQSSGIIAIEQSFTDALFGGASSLTMSIVKYDLRGSIDKTFGSQGEAVIGTNNSAINAYLFEKPYVVETSDGRIVLAGIQQGKQRLVRLWP
jgi:uncharacterized delta-60 repeat protein